MMVAVLLGALSLGACVDDNESASVTAVRDAKTEQLKAAANLANAQAEAELIRANAEAALLAAQAEYEKAKAAAEQATADQREFELKKAQEAYAMELEKIKLEAQFELMKLQDQIADYKKDRLEGEYTRIDRLYDIYYQELTDLNGKKADLIDKQATLAKLEADVISAAEWNKYNTLQSQRNIAKYEAQIAVLKDDAYAGLDPAELQIQLAAKQKEMQLAQTAFAKDPTCARLVATSDPAKLAADEATAQKELVDEVNNLYGGIVDYTYNSGTYYVYKSVTYVEDYTPVFVSYHSDVRINETQKLNADRYFAASVESTANALGTDKDTKDQPTAYGQLAAANAQMEAANKALADAQKMPETTEAEKAAKETAIANAQNDIRMAEDAVAAAKDNLVIYQKNYDDALTQQQAYEEAMKALDVTACNKTAEVLKAALDKQEEARMAWEEAKASVQEIENEYYALAFLVNNSSYDISGEIARLEAMVAQEKANIEDYKLNNNNAESTLAKAKTEIEQLQAEIEAQNQVTEAAKAALDAALASDEEVA